MDMTNTSQQLQLLRFVLAGEEYAFDVLNTREVVEISKITPLPNAQDFMIGVLNLRGNVVPVVDLRRKFKVQESEYTVDTSIIMIEILQEQNRTVIGALVDAVRGVLRCDSQDLEPPPKFGMKLQSRLVQSIAKKNGHFIIVLDVNQVFAENELWEIMSGDLLHSVENELPA